MVKSYRRDSAMGVAFHPINREADQFPKPSVPVLPVLSTDMLLGGGTQHYPSHFLGGDPLLVRRGRIGIALALQALGVSSNDSGLAPAYHCRAVIEPILWSGAAVCYYKLKANLEIALVDVKHKLDNSTNALFLVHFFGVPQ